MPINSSYCCSLDALIKKLEDLQQDGYVFRGQSSKHMHKPTFPYAFRPDSLKKFEENFPSKDYPQWLMSHEANTAVISYWRLPIEELPVAYKRLYKRLSQCLLRLMQYNYFITEYYSVQENDGKFKRQQLRTHVQNLLKYRSKEF